MEKSSAKSGYKSNSVCIMFIIAGVIIGGLIGYYSHSCTSLNRCDNFRETSFIVSCYTDQAIEAKDYSICDEIPGDLYTEGCYSEFAKVTLDENICARLNDSSLKDSCYYKIGVSKKSRIICEMILSEDMTSDCYKQAGLSNSNTPDSSAINETSGDLNKTPVNADLTLIEIPGLNVSIPQAYQCGLDICFQVKAATANTKYLNLSRLDYRLGGVSRNIGYWSISGYPCITTDYLSSKQSCGAKFENIYCNSGDTVDIYYDGSPIASKTITGCK